MDHVALKWLMTASDLFLAVRLHRWPLTLQDYRFNAKYCFGKANVVADALSRAPARAAVVNAGTSENHESQSQTLQFTD